MPFTQTPVRPLVLVTRPMEDAVGLTAPIEALGFAPLIEPMLAIRDRDPDGIDPAPLAPDGLSGLLFTSANGVRALDRLAAHHGLDLRGVPAFAVGDATARTARSSGFRDVRSAGGDVETLADLVASSLDPAVARGLLHPAAGHLAGDLAGRLSAEGFSGLRRIVVYDAIPRARLSEAARDALGGGRVAAALFFSPRTAASFARLLAGEGLESTVGTITAICLGTTVADRLGDLPFQRILVAGRPTQAALVDLLEDVRAGPDVDGYDGAARPEVGMAGKETDSGNAMGLDDERTLTEAVASGRDGTTASVADMKAEAADGGVITEIGPATRSTTAAEPAPVDKAGPKPVTAAVREGAISTESKDVPAAAVPQPAAKGMAAAPVVVHKSGAGALFVALVSLVVAGAALAFPFWRDAAIQAGLPIPQRAAPAEPTIDPAELASLNGKLSALADQVEALASRPAAGGTADLAGPSDGGLSAEVADLTERLGNLAGWIEATGTDVDERLGSLSDRLDSTRADLETRLDALAGRVDSTRETVASRLNGIGERIETAAQAAERRAARAAGAVLSADIEGLDRRIDALEQRADATARIDIEDITEIQGRLTAVETRASDPGLRTQIAGFADSLDALRSRMTALSDQMAALRQTVDSRPVFDPATIAVLRAADADIAAAIDPLRQTVERNGGAIDAIRTALDAGAGVRASDIGMILGIGQLAQDTRGSTPFRLSLDKTEGMARRVFENGLPGQLTDQLAVLKPLADAGVASAPELRRRFPNRAMEAARKALVPEDADLVDRTLAQLTDLVMVRPTDRDAPPQTAAQRLARAETLLAAGDLEGAVNVLGELDGPAAAALSGWLDEARNRLAVDGAVDALLSWAIERLPTLDDPIATTGDNG